MYRILIIGLPGSGKSTFANKLGKKLNRDVTHLDKVYYESGWKHIQTKDEWKETVKNLISKEKWIMDGNYRGTLDMRLESADCVILFNFNKFLCLYRACKRALDKTQPFDKAEGNKNKLSWDLIKKIIFFPKKKMLERLERYKDTKKIFVVKNSKEAEELLIKSTEDYKS
jgi:adenylate kinase family enzyme